MSRQRTNEVYQDVRGIWWARFNGKRHTLNTSKAHQLLMDSLEDQDKLDRMARDDEDAPNVGDLEMIILRGVPGSGKSTWAEQHIADYPWFKRISRDHLRAMFDCGKYSFHNEKFIRDMRDRLIRRCLDAGHPVIIDDTNLKERDIRDLRSEAYTFGALDPRYGYKFRTHCPIPVRIVDIETPLEVCIERDALRQRPVGADRIREMHEDFMRAIGKWEPSSEMIERMRDAVEKTASMLRPKDSP